MPRYSDEWDEEYRARRGYGPGRGWGEREFGPPRPYRRGPAGYEYGGRPTGPRGEYDHYVRGRGDYYPDDDYYAGRRRVEDDRRHFYGGRGGERGGPPPRGAARSHLRCRDIMTRDVTVASRDTTLDEVARMMRGEDTGIIPVVDPGGNSGEAVAEQQRVPFGAGSGGRLVGLITDRDIVVRALAEGRDPREVRAGEVMTTDLHTALPNDRVIEVIRLMGDKQVRRIPVVDREGNLRGIISMADVALETEADRELADALEEISSGHSFWNRIFG